MNRLSFILIAVFTAILFSFQISHWIYISNGGFLKIDNFRANNYTEKYDIHVEILETPKMRIYNEDMRLINFLDEHWYKAEKYNYLWINSWDKITYPFRIKQTYHLKNDTNKDKILDINYFPIHANNTFVFPSYPTKETWKNNYPSILIWEDYWIMNPLLLHKNKYIPLSRKYVLTKLLDYGNAIQYEYMSKIILKAWESSELVFTYYATDIPKEQHKNNKSNYHATYHFWWSLFPEPLYVDSPHTILLPEGYSATYLDKEFAWPFEWEVPVGLFWDVTIYKEN